MKTRIAIAFIAAAAAGPLAGAAVAQSAEARVDRLFAEMDADGNDVITREELAVYRDFTFQTADIDADGIVTEAELEAFVDASGAANGRARHQAASPFTEADADDNGEVTRAEFDAGPTPLFNRLDRNDDGEATREEAEAVLARYGWLLGGG